MPFSPGVSGNPSGRPKGSAGVAVTVRRRFGGSPRQLVEALGLIATGQPEDVEREFGVRPALADRVAAVSELLSLGWSGRQVHDADQKEGVHP